VFRGCVKIAQQGYWAGGKPRYGFRRLLLNEARQPVQSRDQIELCGVLVDLFRSARPWATRFAWRPMESLRQCPAV